MPFETRAATLDDVPALVDLVNSAYRGDSSRAGWTTEADLLGGRRIDAQRLTAAILSAGNVILVHQRAGAIVACLHLQRTGDECYLGMLTTQPAIQGQGLGRQMLEAAEAWAVQHWDARAIHMTVLVQRTELIEWYERRGYVVTGERKPFPYNDVRYGEPRRPDLEFHVMRKNAPFERGALMTDQNQGAGHPIVDTGVSIATPDGTCDAAFVHPSNGAHAAVIVWTDAFGLRPSMRHIAKRLAAQGYAVLVPNPFYRLTPAPIFEDMAAFDFSNPADRAKLTPLMASVAADGAAERDAVAFVMWLDAQAAVDRSRKIGTQGYCMGGALAMRTAAAVPHRVGAVASFHGGGLVTDQPNSPHRLAPKMRARVYVAVASNDDERQPQAKDALREAFEAAHVPAAIEVYSSLHGWCVPDMPAQAGHQIYNEPDAEKAWAKLVELYATALS